MTNTKPSSVLFAGAISTFFLGFLSSALTVPMWCVSILLWTLWFVFVLIEAQ